MSEQLELLAVETWRCPLYGCRRRCECSPEKIEDTKRRLALSRAEGGAARLTPSDVASGPSASESTNPVDPEHDPIPY